MNYIPIDNVFNYTPEIIRKNMKDDNLMKSWALQAYRSIDFESSQYNRKIAFIESSSHTGSVPEDLVKVHKVSMLTDVDVQALINLYECPDCEEGREVGRDNPCPITHRYFINSAFYAGSSWAIAKEVSFINSDFFCKVTTQSCKPLYHLRNKTIYTSSASALIALDYFSFIKDDNGNFLLPELPIVMWQYLAKHIERRYLEERALNFEGSEMMDFRKRNQVAQLKNEALSAELSLRNHWRATMMLSNLRLENQKAIQSNAIIHSADILRSHLSTRYAI